MPRPCSVCQRSDVDAINAALVTGNAPLNGIARQYGVAQRTLGRHRDNCLTGSLKTAAATVAAAEAAGVPMPPSAVRDMVRAERLSERLQHRMEALNDALCLARNQNDVRAVIAGIKEAIAVEVKLQEVLDSETVEMEVDLSHRPEVASVVDKIVTFLETEHPEAATALREGAWIDA